MRLAKLSSDVAPFQMANMVLFVIENPYGSEMWALAFLVVILEAPGVFAVNLQMCADGLKGPFNDLAFMFGD